MACSSLTPQALLLATASNARTFTLVSIVSNVTSSVGLILLVKHIVAHYHFNYSSTLTFLHCLVAAIVMYLVDAFIFNSNSTNNNTATTVAPITPTSVVAAPSQQYILSTFDRYAVAIAQTASIILMNISLSTNSVGLYQIAKLAIIPCIIAIQVSYFKHNLPSFKIAASIVLVLAGVGYATVTDVSLNYEGLVAAIAAILVTSVHQIRLGTVQASYKIQSYRMMLEIALPLVYASGVSALLFEILDFQTMTLNLQLVNHIKNVMNTREVVVIFISCLAAVIVQLSTLTMIKATSAVTYQIVGHTKTCLIIVIGYLLFPSTSSSRTSKASNSSGSIHVWKHVIGICVALTGTIMYSYFKHAENLQQAQEAKKVQEEQQQQQGKVESNHQQQVQVQQDATKDDEAFVQQRHNVNTISEKSV